MKTALTELIEKWERLNNVAKHTTDAPMVSSFINSAKELLEKEKQQIKYAYEQGHSDGDIEDYPHYKDSEQYFNQTFLSNE